MATPIFTNKLMVDATSLTTAVLSNYKVTPVTTPSHHGVITTEVSGITQTTSGTDVSLYLFIAPDPLPTAIATVAHLVDAGCAVEYGVRLNPGDHLALTQDILRVNEAMYVMPVGGTVSVACKGVGLPEDGTSDLSSNIDLIGYSGVSVTPTVTLSVPVLAITGVYATNGIDITVTLTATPNPAVVPTGDTLSTITYSLKDSTAGSAELVTTNSGMSYSKNVTLTAPAASVASWTASVTYTTAASISESSTAVTLQRTSVKYPIIAPTLTATAKYTDASKTKVNLTLSSTAAAGMVTGDSLSVVNWTCTPKTAPSTPIVLNDTTAALSNTMSSIAVDATGWDITVKYTTVKGGVVTSATVSILNANIAAAAASTLTKPTVTASAMFVSQTDTTKVNITIDVSKIAGLSAGDALKDVTYIITPTGGTPATGVAETPVYDPITGLTTVTKLDIASSTTGWDITVKYTSVNGDTVTSDVFTLVYGNTHHFTSVTPPSSTLTALATWTDSNKTVMDMNLSTGLPGLFTGFSVSSITWAYVPYAGNVAGSVVIVTESTPLTPVDSVNGIYGEDILNIPVSTATTKWDVMVRFGTGNDCVRPTYTVTIDKATGVGSGSVGYICGQTSINSVNLTTGLMTLNSMVLLEFDSNGQNATQVNGRWATGVSNSTVGYICGLDDTRVESVSFTYVGKITFSTASAVRATASLNKERCSAAGVSDGVYGYIWSGGDHETLAGATIDPGIDRITLADGTVTAWYTGLQQSRYDAVGVSNSTVGYICGGTAASYSYLASVDKINMADGVLSATSLALTDGYIGMAAVSNTVDGYLTGGATLSNGAQLTIHNLGLSTGTCSITGYRLTAQRFASCGLSGSARGFIVGGSDVASSDMIDLSTGAVANTAITLPSGNGATEAVGVYPK